MNVDLTYSLNSHDANHMVGVHMHALSVYCLTYENMYISFWGKFRLFVCLFVHDDPKPSIDLFELDRS